VRPGDDVHRVQLEHTHITDDSPEVTHIDATGRPRNGNTLGADGNSARSIQ
jgi:hypothetical protein